MVSPDGKEGTVPAERAADAAKAGFKSKQPAPTRYNSNPSFANYAPPDSPLRNVPEPHPEQNQIVEPAKHETITGLGRAALGAVPFAMGGEGELAEAPAMEMPSMGAAKPILTAPIRLAARTAERAVNDIPILNTARAAKGLMSPADEAAGMRIKIPGRDVGLGTASPPMTLPQDAFDTSAAEKAVTPIQGVGTPAPPGNPVRRVPGDIPREAVAQPPAMRVPAIAQQTGTSQLPGGGVIQRPAMMLPPAPEAPAAAAPAMSIPESAPVEVTPQGPPLPNPVRRVPGDIPREAIAQPPAMRVPAIAQQTGTSQLPGGGVIQRPAMMLPPAPEAPAAEIPKTSIRSFANQVVDQNIPPEAPKLQPNVSLRNQMPSAGQKVSDVVNQNTEQEAVRPLASGPQKNMSLRDIAKQGPPAEAVPHRATVTHEGKTFGMEAANGRKMYEATQSDTGLAKQVHDLRGPEVRQAFVNLGGDVNKVGLEGQRFKVGSSSTTERNQMFDWMLDQGHSPQEIIAAAKKPM
jgi:hypothetical protein